MENGPFIDDFPIKATIYRGFSMAMLNNQMVAFVCSMSFDHFRATLKPSLFGSFGPCTVPYVIKPGDFKEFTPPVIKHWVLENGQ